MDAAMSLSLVLHAIKVPLLLAPLALMTFLFRRRSARLRATIWMMAFAGVAMLPVAAIWLPSLPVALPGCDWLVVQPHRVEARAAQVEPQILQVEGRHGAVRPVDRPAGLSVGSPATSQVDGPTRVRLRLTTVWLAGFCLVLTGSAIGWWRARGVVRRAVPVDDPDWRRHLARAARLLTCRRRVDLAWSDEIEIPATVGVLRPVVLMPHCADGWVADRREAVLMHELAHIKRWDWPARLVAQVVCALHWYDPLVWWAWRRLGYEQELACDEEVVDAGVRPSHYASHLLQIARAARPRSLTCVPALELARRTHVEERIMHVLNRSWIRRSTLRLGLVCGVAAVLLMPAIAAVRPAATPPDAPGAKVTAPAAPAAPATSEPAPVGSVTPVAAEAPAPPAPPTPAEQVASPELAEAIAAITRLEKAIEPQIQEIDEIVRIQIESRTRDIEAQQREIEKLRMHEIEARLEPHLEKLRDLEVDLEPYHEELAELGEKLAALSLERRRADDEEFAETRARIEALRLEMEPVLAKLETIHAEMEPVHAELQSLETAMAPQLQEIERLMADLEPVQGHIETLQKAIEPVQEDLERMSERVGELIRAEIESTVRGAVAGLVDADAPFDEVARRVADIAEIHVHDNLLSVTASRREVREILGDLLEPRRATDSGALAEALDLTADLVSNLRRAVPPAE